MIETDGPGTGRKGATARDKAMSVGAALSAEFCQMHPKAPQQPSGGSLEEFFAAVHNLPQGRAALCLSGGGIRSASFAVAPADSALRASLPARDTLQSFAALMRS